MHVRPRRWANSPKTDRSCPASTMTPGPGKIATSLFEVFLLSVAICRAGRAERTDGHSSAGRARLSGRRRRCATSGLKKVMPDAGPDSPHRAEIRCVLRDNEAGCTLASILAGQ